MRKSITLVTALFLALTVGACGFGPDESREDARDTKDVDKTPPHVIAFNNQFPNVSTKCDGYGHRIFVTSHNNDKVQPRLIILPDPTCEGYVKGQEPAIVSTGGGQ